MSKPGCPDRPANTRGTGFVSGNRLEGVLEHSANLASPRSRSYFLKAQLYFLYLPIASLQDRTVGVFNSVDKHFLVEKFSHVVGQAIRAYYLARTERTVCEYFDLFPGFQLYRAEELMPNKICRIRDLFELILPENDLYLAVAHVSNISRITKPVEITRFNGPRLLNILFQSGAAAINCILVRIDRALGHVFARGSLAVLVFGDHGANRRNCAGREFLARDPHALPLMAHDRNKGILILILAGDPKRRKTNEERKDNTWAHKTSRAFTTISVESYYTFPPSQIFFKERHRLPPCIVRCGLVVNFRPRIIEERVVGVIFDRFEREAEFLRGLL